jgi:hypothetical protein
MSKTISTLFLAAALAVVGCGKKNDAPADKVEAAKPVAAETAPAADKAAPAADKAAPAADKAAPAADKAATPSAPAATGATVASDDEYLQKGTAMLTKLIDTFKADGTDCDKLATDIDAIHSDPQFAALETYEKAHADAKKKLDKASKDQTKAFETAATPAMKACQKNQKLMDVLAKFN